MEHFSMESWLKLGRYMSKRKATPKYKTNSTSGSFFVFDHL